jgi:hypothetical protein
VLCLLRHAEAVTRDHVAETTGWDLSDLELAFGIDAPDAGFDPGQGAGNGLADGHIFTGSGSGPADALALAWRLRALAAVLGSLLSSTRHPNDWTIDLDGWTAVPEATPRGLAPRADSLFVILNGRRHAFQDTS